VAFTQPAGPDATGRANDYFRNLVFEPKVSDNLALLFEKFDTELVLCLEGERRGLDLYITDFRMPHIFMSETGRVQAESCKLGPHSVGTWHNHPSPYTRIVNSSPDVQARNCYLSRTDITDFRRRAEAHVTVVSCAPQIYAYWLRGDVDSVVGEVALLPPPVGKLVHSKIQDGREDGGLTQARGR
jgi:hypothetical protein